MKKLVLVLSAGLFFTAAHAQQSSWYIGGNAGYNMSQQKATDNGVVTQGPRSSSWSFSPEVGTFLTDNFQLGAAITLAGSKAESRDFSGRVYKSNMFGGTLYGRYFFGNGIFRPFVGINATVLPGSGTFSSTVNATVKTQTMDFGANLNAGFAFALSSRFTAVGSFGAVGYSQSSSKEEGSTLKSKTESFGFKDAGTLGQRFTVGVYYTFLK